MTFKSIHHPAFVTGDLDKTIRFWRDLLGMRLALTLGKPGNRQAFFSVAGETFVVFFEWPGAEPIPYLHHGTPRSGQVVFDHLCILVETESDMWELMGKLDAAGIPVSDAVDHGFLRSIYTYDPNGIPLEFTCGHPQHDIVADPRIADLEPTPATREGPDPIPGHWPEPEEVPDDERILVPGEGHEEFKDG